MDLVKEEGNLERLRKGRETFGVFCHGDASLENFVFKYKSELESELFPCEVILQNFTNGTYASPVLDLLYFIFTRSEGLA